MILSPVGLRQDEVAEFIRSRKGEKYSALLPLFGLHDLEVAAENLRQLVRAIERKSALDHKQGAFNQTRAKRIQVFGTDGKDKIKEIVTALHSKDCPKSPSTSILVCCDDVEAAIAERISVLSMENRRHIALSAVANTDLTGALQAVRNAK